MNNDDKITTVRNAVKKIIDGFSELQNFRTDIYTPLDCGNPISANKIVDGLGENTGIGITEMNAVVGTTLPALETFMSQGHATNIAKLL